jgi:hypothetical protein
LCVFDFIILCVFFVFLKHIYIYIYIYIYIFFFFLFGGTGELNSGLALARQVGTLPLGTLSPFLCVGYF